MLPLLLLAVAAPSPGAAASPKPTLPPTAAVFVASGDDAADAAAEAALLKALGDAEVEAVDAAAAFPAPEPDGTGARLVTEARQAYDDLDYEASAAKWGEALAWFTQHPEAASAKGLGEAHFFVAVLAVQNGGKAQAKRAAEEFARALVFDPSVRADAQTYGNDVKKAFDKALQDVNGRAQAPLAVTSGPPGAQVTFRDQAIGATPLEPGPMVPVGRHLVRLARPGYLPQGALADVTKDGGRAQATLAPVGGYAEVRAAASTLVASGLGTSGAAPAGGKKVGAIVKARFLVLGNGKAVEAWDVETGNRLTGLSTEAGELARTASKIKDFTKKPPPVTAARPVAVADQGGAVPVYQKWWFWTAVGAVAVGTATTIGVVAANNSGGRPYNVVLGIP